MDLKLKYVMDILADIRRYDNGKSKELNEAIDDMEMLFKNKVSQVRNPEFNKLLDEMRKIHDTKNRDYSGELSLYQNFMETEDMGIPAWKGVIVRMTDKFCRLKGFAKKEALEVKDESIEDTLLDLANYSLLCILIRRIVVQDGQKSDIK